MPYVATKNTERRMAQLRAFRTAALAATDFAVLPDSPLHLNKALLNFRTALRECTKAPEGEAAMLPTIDPALPTGIKGALEKIYQEARNAALAH